MKLLFLAMTLLVGTHISPAQASSCGGENHVKHFEKMAEKYFMQMDLNNDGSIDKVEFEESQMSKMINSFDVLQPDENGVIQKIDFIKAFIKAHLTPRTEA